MFFEILMKVLATDFSTVSLLLLRKQMNSNLKVQILTRLLKRSHQELQTRVNNRFVTLNNRGTEEQKLEFCEKFFAMVDSIMENNVEKCFTMKAAMDSLKQRKQRKEEEKQQEEDRLKKERDKFETSIKARYAKILSDLLKDLRRLQQLGSQSIEDGRFGSDMYTDLKLGIQNHHQQQQQQQGTQNHAENRVNTQKLIDFERTIREDIRDKNDSEKFKTFNIALSFHILFMAIVSLTIILGGNFQGWKLSTWEMSDGGRPGDTCNCSGTLREDFRLYVGYGTRLKTEEADIERFVDQIMNYETREIHPSNTSLLGSCLIPDSVHDDIERIKEEMTGSETEERRLEEEERTRREMERQRAEEEEIMRFEAERELERLRRQRMKEEEVARREYLRLEAEKEIESRRLEEEKRKREDRGLEMRDFTHIARKRGNKKWRRMTSVF